MVNILIGLIKEVIELVTLVSAGSSLTRSFEEMVAVSELVVFVGLTLRFAWEKEILVLRIRIPLSLIRHKLKRLFRASTTH